MKTEIILLIIIVSVLVLSLGNDNLQEGLTSQYYCDPAHPRNKNGKGGMVEARCQLHDETVDPHYVVYKSLDHCEKMCDTGHPRPPDTTHHGNDQPNHHNPNHPNHHNPNHPDHHGGGNAPSGTHVKKDDLGNITVICANNVDTEDQEPHNHYPPGHYRSHRYYHHPEANSTDHYDPVDVAPSTCGGPYF